MGGGLVKSHQDLEVTDVDFRDFGENLKLLLSHIPSILIMQMHRIGLFEFVVKCDRSLDEIRKQFDWNENSATSVLSILQAEGLLTISGSQVRLTAKGRKWFTTVGEFYLGPLLERGLDIIERSRNLTEALRKGFDSSVHISALRAFGGNRKRTLEFMQVMERFSLFHFRAVETIFLENKTGYRRVLDVGCGPATLSRLLIERGHANAVDLIDFEGVIEIALEHFIPERLHRKMTAIGYDVTAFSGNGMYSLVILSNVLHEFSRTEAAALVARACDALERGGQLWVVGLLGDPQNHTFDQLSYYFTLPLLVEMGSRNYRFEDIREMTFKCGVVQENVLDVGGGRSLWIGSRSQN